MKMRKGRIRWGKTSALVVGLLLAAGLSLVIGPAAQATAPCEGTYTVVVGGWQSTPDTDGFHGNIQQHIGYSTAIPNGAGVRTGVDELNRWVWDQRKACPGQHVKMVGYSMGAAVVHVWVTENGDAFGNVNAVLIADPKRQAPPGASGGGVPFGGLVGAPLAGADRFFGGVPVFSICNWDYVCDESAGIGTYPGNHVNNYADRNVDAFSDDGNGQWFNGAFVAW